MRRSSAIGCMSFRAVIMMTFVVVQSVAPFPACGTQPTPSGLQRVKTIHYALKTYEERKRRMPPAQVKATDGTPIYSWRVLLLPELCRIDLFNLLHDDLRAMRPCSPTVYQKVRSVIPQDLVSPNRLNEGPMTNYVAVVGPGTIWDRGGSMAMPDSASASPPVIVVAEIANSDIHWMEPRDLTIEEFCQALSDQPEDGPCQRKTQDTFFFRYETTGSWVVLSDGNFLYLPGGIRKEVVRGLLTDTNPRVSKADLVGDKMRFVRRIKWGNCVCVAGVVLAVLLLALWLWSVARRHRNGSLHNNPGSPHSANTA